LEPRSIESLSTTTFSSQTILFHLLAMATFDIAEDLSTVIEADGRSCCEYIAGPLSGGWWKCLGITTWPSEDHEEFRLVGRSMNAKVLDFWQALGFLFVRKSRRMREGVLSCLLLCFI
jgi:hypothetical protein